MIRLNRRARGPIRHLNKLCRFNHTATQEPAVAESQKGEDAQTKLREKVLAEALAREEEAIVRQKALRELKERTRLSIHALNSAPSEAISGRLQSLQNQLNSLPHQDKVRQLDEEIEDFLFHATKLPVQEVRNRPWYQSQNDLPSAETTHGDDLSSSKIRSSTNSGFLNQYPNLKPTPDYKSYSQQELFLRYMSHIKQSGSLGSELTNVYNPSDDVHNPDSIADVSIATLLAAGCHLGHARALWRPSTQPFIYGEYEGIHLIDLNETLTALRSAAKVVKGVAARGGVILYVGTTRLKEQVNALEEAARRSNAYYVSQRWIPGTITNFTEVTKQIKGASRKEVDLGDVPTGRVLDGEEGAIIKPDLIVLMNPVENRNCIEECLKSRIPTIGLCDTNMEPSLLTYPIPCNDDSMRASSLILGVLSNAAKQGVEERHLAMSEYKKNGGNVHKMPNSGAASKRT